MNTNLDTIKKNLPGLSGSTLKILALVTMVIDHVGAVFLPQYRILRMIGRLAFPIYAFLLVEGVLHTHDIRKYMMRLGIFAILSEPCFDLAFHSSFFYIKSQNVFFTLLLGAIAVYNMKKYEGRSIGIAWALLCIIAAQLGGTDYHGGGVVIILIFYFFRQNIPAAALCGALTNMCWYTAIEQYSLISYIPIFLYNGKRGLQLKYVFYAIYPLHLLAFGLIHTYL